MRNPADRLQVAMLGRQLFPESPRFLAEAFDDATSDVPFSYLMLNLHPHNQDMRMKVCTGIFSDEKLFVYLPKKKCKKHYK